MTQTDEVYVMSFLYEALTKYIEYCEKKHRDFNQEAFVMISKKFIQNLCPHEKGLSPINQTLQQVQPIQQVQQVQQVQQQIPQVISIEKPIQQVQQVQQIQDVQPVQNIRNVRHVPQVIENNNIENNRPSATSQRLNSFSTLLAKRQT